MNGTHRLRNCSQILVPLPSAKRKSTTAAASAGWSVLHSPDSKYPAETTFAPAIVTAFATSRAIRGSSSTIRINRPSSEREYDTGKRPLRLDPSHYHLNKANA